jgi:hypothetical protein
MHRDDILIKTRDIKGAFLALITVALFYFIFSTALSSLVDAIDINNQNSEKLSCSATRIKTISTRYNKSQ